MKFGVIIFGKFSFEIRYNLGEGISFQNKSAKLVPHDTKPKNVSISVLERKNHVRWFNDSSIETMCGIKKQ